MTQQRETTAKDFYAPGRDFEVCTQLSHAANELIRKGQATFDGENLTLTPKGWAA